MKNADLARIFTALRLSLPDEEPRWDGLRDCLDVTEYVSIKAATVDPAPRMIPLDPVAGFVVLRWTTGPDDIDIDGTSLGPSLAAEEVATSTTPAEAAYLAACEVIRLRIFPA